MLKRYQISFLMVLFSSIAIFLSISVYKPNKIEETFKKRDYKKMRYEFDKIYSHRRRNFRAWDLLPSRDPNIDLKERMSLMKFNQSYPGINGNPVILKDHLRGQVQVIEAKGWQDHAFNEFVSEMIPLNRDLPDPRDDWCKQYNYLSDLPQASVVICFHNEAWSTLLRTIHSVLNQSPSEFLAEIILIDDFSTMEHLKERLDQYLKIFNKVRLVRNSQREGLIRSRLRGIKYSTGPVIVYLDSHCECTKGWLEPLLDRVAKYPKTVVSPIVDYIHEDTFEYIAQSSDEIRLGGFTWDLKFTWIPIPIETYNNRQNQAAPIETPAISGGLFAVNKDFFISIGTYDERFDSWGAENLELSFKVWMCGGSLEMIPCSHVGHVFRKRFPYKREPGSARKNAMRLAKGWMDNYANYFFQRMGTAKFDYGNVTNVQELRKKLKCNSFKWYLENIYPQMVIPGEFAASGSISSIDYDGWCLDVPNNYMDTINFYPCHNRGGSQYWTYTKNGEIRRDNVCLDYVFHNVVLNFCLKHKPSQIWFYNEKTQKILHLQTRHCLTVTKHNDYYYIQLLSCIKIYRQKWHLENFNFQTLSPTLRSNISLMTYL